MFDPTTIVLVVICIVVMAVLYVKQFWSNVKTVTFLVKALSGQLQEIESSLHKAIQVSQSGGSLAPREVQRIQSLWTKSMGQLRNMDDLGRQKYEAKCTELMGMANDAGISFTPPSF